MKTLKFHKSVVGLLILCLALCTSAGAQDERRGEQQAVDPSQVEAVNSWIVKDAILLKSIEAGRGFKDLKSLRKILKNVRVVGLGEATHGSREFFQIKHRLLEFLVTKMDYRIFAIEASYAACNNINNYVLYGKGDPAEALASQKFWTWDTHEVRDMIAWMRQYNEKAPEHKKVQFLGYDLQHLEQGMDLVAGYITKHLPEYAETVKAAMESIRITPLKIAELPKAKPEEKAQNLSKLHEMLGILTFHEVPLARDSSSEAFAYVMQHARVITQFYRAYSKSMMGSDPANSAAALRDLYMAENIEYILNREGPDARIVVWAHNGHISNATWGMNFPAMGMHLKKLLGDAYYSLGFTFSEGSFQSRLIDPQHEENGALIEFTVGASPEGSVGWYLAQPGIDNYILNLRQTPENDAIRKWLTTAHPMRFIGSGFSHKYGEKQSMAPVVLKDHFDGMIFIRNTTRARPNPSGEREPFKKPVEKK